MRTSKSEKYAFEQFLIQKEIISLLGLEKGFYLYKLDRDVNKQETIMNMVPEIWTYFAHMNVTGLLYPERCKRPWLSIVRGVLKNRYSLKYKACRYLSKDGSVFTMRYYVEPRKDSEEEEEEEEGLSMTKSTSTESLSDGSNFGDSSSEGSSCYSDDSSGRLTLCLKRKRNKLDLQLKYRKKKRRRKRKNKNRFNFDLLIPPKQI